MKDTFISLAIILFPEDHLDAVKAYADYLEENYSDHEILLIGQKTPPDIDTLLKHIDKIRFLQIFNAADYEVLCAAALENSIGDIAVIGNLRNLTMDVIGQGVEHCFAGADIVIGITNVRRPFWYRLGSSVFRTIISKVVQYDLPANDSGLRFVSRRAANAVISGSKFHQSLFLQLNRCGYHHEMLNYSTGKNLNKELSLSIIFRHAVSLLVLNSTKPLRFANFLGLVASFISLLFATYSIVIHLFKKNIVEGWTTQIFFSSILFFFLFLILAFLGEYMLRLLSNQNNNSAYSVVSEKHSSVMLDAARLNVLNESTSDEVNLTQTGRDR